MESQRTQEILTRAQQENQIVCLYSSPCSVKFAAGWVEALSESAVILRSISPNGRTDGWALRVLSEIARLDVGGLYEERLGFLVQMHEAHWMECFLPNCSAESDLMWDLFVACQKHDFAAVIDTGSDDEPCGFIQDVTPQWVTLDKINFHGHFDGQTTVATEDIKAITVGNQDLQDLQILARRHGRGSGGWR